MIFTRDLRIKDNLTLFNCNQKSEQIIPCFIFTPSQTSNRNSFKSDNAIQFMVESLNYLNRQLCNKLNIFYGETTDIVKELLKKHSIDTVYISKDYTPYAQKREQSLLKLDVKIEIVDDYCLYVPGTILNGSGQPYQKYTPYKNKAKTVAVTVPKTADDCVDVDKLLKIPTNYSLKRSQQLFKSNKNVHAVGGDNSEVIFENLVKFKDYENIRNKLKLQTTGLSPYIKFGNLSIRMVYTRVVELYGKQHPIIDQLIWHDFYYQLGVAFPRVFKGALKEKYNKLDWNYDQKQFNAWKQGRTGYPIIDAAMTQLNSSGFMHNRARMIVASFLVKTLFHNWQLGEKYFAQQLVDYDPLVNNGNWQWIASTGADSQPYFRIFNPWLQSQKFDPDASYIKRWLPHLAKIPAKELHQWYKYHTKYNKNSWYIAPIVDYSSTKEAVLAAYKAASKSS